MKRPVCTVIFLKRRVKIAPSYFRIKYFRNIIITMLTDVYYAWYIMLVYLAQLFLCLQIAQISYCASTWNPL